MLPTTQTLFDNHRAKIERELKKTFTKRDALNFVKKMMGDFFAPTETKFETLYAGWEIAAAMYGLELPSIEDCEAALNDQACNELRFAEYFINHFNL